MNNFQVSNTPDPIITKYINNLRIQVNRLVNRIDFIIEHYDTIEPPQEERKKNLKQSLSEDFFKEFNDLKNHFSQLLDRLIRLESNHNKKTELLHDEIKEIKKTLEEHYPTFDDLGCYVKTDQMIALTERIVMLESRLEMGEF